MESFKTLQDTLSAALVSTTRSATQLGAADIPFQRSLDPEIGTALDSQNARLLQLTQRLLENVAASSDAVGPKLPDAEAIDGNWKGVVDVVDSLLEKADRSLDEYTGVVKRFSPAENQTATPSKGKFMTVPKTFEKPQLSFDNAPQNHETGGFKPLMTSKPHAKVSMADSLKTFKDSEGREQYPHPYQTEIESYQYPPSMYEIAEPQQYPPFETTTATFVDTPEALAMMLAELKTAREIAIDLEHHDNRSYIGLVSLMQISTRDKDWIVDTLKPWRRRLECLNEVFADPNILKVLHGAYMDIVWLQRDLGLYIVGLFDTYHAARALGYPGASLAFLLDKFVNFKAQKQYQMADWRVRPLSEEMFKYARADTHFLLYVFDNMRNELIERSDFSSSDKDKISEVLNKSKETALQRYEHPVYDYETGQGPVGWYRPLMRTPAQFTKQQFAVFKAVHKWRDDVARKEDDSPAFIMPNHAVFAIARALPSTKAELTRTVQHVSHILRARADEVVNVIKDAKVAGIEGPDMNETIKNIEDQRAAQRGYVVPVSGAALATTAVPVLQPASKLAFLDTPPLRAKSSSFWGKLWSGTVTEQRRPASTLGVNLALPLPPLTAEIFADIAGTANAETAKVEKPEHTFVPKEDRPPEDEDGGIFVVKQLGGRKRKREEAQATSATDHNPDADEIMLDEDPLAQQKAEKAARKAARKEKKRQKALQEASTGLTYDEDEPAFDYANAPSVLNANKNSGEKNGRKKKEKKKDKGFNPYAQLTNAPKGLPRAQKEVAGRSKTFSS